MTVNCNRFERRPTAQVEKLHVDMSENIESVLSAIKDFTFPFLVLASVVFILVLTIKKFDFFNASCKWLGLDISAGRHDKSKGNSQK
jgi:hypothetical protein